MIHTAKELVAVGHTGANCRVDYQTDAGKENAFLFPFAQLDGLVGLLLQVKRTEVEKEKGAKHVLFADAVEVSLDEQTQNVLLDFEVGEMRFAFALPRETAVRMMAILRDNLPTH